MDFFSKLFSFSDTRKSRQNEVRRRISVDECGLFCRESRVDLIEPIIVTVTSDDAKRSSAGLTRTLDSWNPETCVRLLRMPSVQNYAGLCKLIQKSDKNWMIEFLEMGGLQVLFESVDRLDKRRSRLEHTYLLLQCVSCLKAVTNSHIALQYIIQQGTYAKKIAEVLCSKNPMVKKQLFEFMSTLCVFSEDGHYLTLDAFECYRVTGKFRYRFMVLINEIKQAEVMPYIGAVLGLINCIILGACGFRFRTRIRNEFLALGLQDLLESLNGIPEDEVQLQCSVFCKSQLADEEYARSMGIRASFSHFALFQTLLDKIEDTPLSASLLVLLQNLNQLDSTDTKTDYVWSILEEITERALTGADSVLGSWMLSECRRSSFKSVATQTSIFAFHKLPKEEPVRMSICDENCEKDSIKSFSSLDSGIPVSRNPSFASSCPKSPQSTLWTQSSLENTFAEAVKDSTDAEFSNAVKGCINDESPRTIKEQKDLERIRPSKNFFKAMGLSFTFMSRANKNPVEENPTKIPSLSLQSESPNITLREEKGKMKKIFSLPLFSRSKKYTLPDCPPTLTVNSPSPNMHRNARQTPSPASTRNGMTSMDVKRSRKQNILLCDNDSSSFTSEEFSSETASTFEFYKNYPQTQSSPISKSFSKIEFSPTSGNKEGMGQLSKSTSDLYQAIPPPPPPPPPPNFSLSEVLFRPRSQNVFGLPSGKPIRSSWSGNSTIKEFEAADERLYSTLPRPKSKMKTLNWSKIPSTHVTVHSIWSEIDQEVRAMDLNFEEMEKLFCQDESISMIPRQKQRTTSKISLLDSKRSLSIGVFLKQFKGGLEEVVEYLKECKHKEIGAERLRTLLNLFPDSNEIKLLKSYNGDMDLLGTAEKFILRLHGIDRYDCRVEGMLLLEEFPATVQALHDSVQSLLDASQELLTNTGLKNFLKLILVTGNFMNSGSYAGNAIGFRLSTLPKLMETRANRPRITLLHYLVEETLRENQDGLKFTDELLDKLKRCSRLSVEGLSSEIMQLDNVIKKLKTQIEVENGQLKKKFFGFIENGVKHLTVLMKKLSEIRHISTQLANRFSEDEKKFQLEECLNVVSVFCTKIQLADAENQARKGAEKKKRMSGNKMDSKFQVSKTLTL